MKPVQVRKPKILGKVPAGEAVLEASAGTGKTYTLEHLIVDAVVAHQVPIEEILAVTFTERAAAELKAKVRKRLAEVLAGEPRAPGGAGASSWTIDDAARARLGQAIAAFESATICTIHAFCHRILSENAFLTGRLFHEDQARLEDVFARALRDVLRKKLAVDPVLSPFLRAFLDLDRDGVAGLERFLLECHRKRGTLEPVYDQQALAKAVATYPVKLVGDRLATELKALGAHGATIKAASGRLEGLAPLVAEAQSSRDLAALLGAVDDLDRDTSGGLVGYLRDRLPTGGKLAPIVALLEALVPLRAAVAGLFLPLVRERLVAIKREEGLIDFDDMLALLDAALSGPSGPALQQSLAARYRVALIDEFQDTDDVQWRVFDKLFGAAAGAGAGRRLILIGDPKQAIYSFRGADVHTYLAARDRVAARAGKAAVVPLDENFRSTPEMIEAYNAILAQDPNPADSYFDPARRIVYQPPVKAGRPKLVLRDAKGKPAKPICLLQLKPSGDKLNAADARSGLAAAIADEIEKLLTPKTALSFGSDDEADLLPVAPITLKDIYVLTRTRFEGLRIGDVLRERGIAHAFYKQDGLFASAEAHHVRDLLAAVVDPHTPARRYAAWLTPFFGMTLADMPALREVSGSDPLMARLLEWHTLADERDLEALFQHVIDDSGIARRQAFTEGGERALTNVLHLFEILLEEAQASATTLPELLTSLRRFMDGSSEPAAGDRNVQRLESERAAVQIMTVHVAKGLEAPVVFVAGGLTRLASRDKAKVFHDATGARIVRIGEAPAAIDQAIKAEAADENRRLLYVALTRARARLYLPFVEKPPKGKGRDPIEGPYRPVVDRLRLLVNRKDPVLDRHFALLDVPCPAVPSPRPQVAAADLSSFVVPPAASAPDPVAAAGEHAALAKQHVAPYVTSYSGMRGRKKYVAPEDLDGDLDREDLGEAEGELDELAVVPTPLPGGKQLGLCLHAMLEEVDLAPLAAAEGLAAWKARPEVQQIAARAARANGVAKASEPAALDAVHAALTAPIGLGPGVRLAGGFAAAAASAREVEFVYPYPEASHPRLFAAVPPGGLDIGRGWVRGFVDYLFEHDGKAYFLDWKSDRLPSYGPPTVTAHVQANYALQAKLYAIALVKLYGISGEADYEARFGGIVYAFVRGMVSGLAAPATSPGVYFHRPSFAEMQAWSRELEERAS